MTIPRAVRQGRGRGSASRYFVDLEGPGYSAAELEFFRAIDRYKRAGHPHPTWAEVLAVAKALGYRCVAEPAAQAG